MFHLQQLLERTRILQDMPRQRERLLEGLLKTTMIPRDMRRLLVQLPEEQQLMRTPKGTTSKIGS
jgi:hypothetical protein